MSDQQVHYVTAESLENLKKEKENIENKKIPEIAKRIDEAKQQGDLSENAEYHQAREDMSWTRGRLTEIERILQNAQVFETPTGSDEITLGNRVKVKVNENVREFTIVGQQEVDPAKGFISNQSPIGEALLGHSKGDKIEIETPSGKQTYEVMGIE